MSFDICDHIAAGMAQLNTDKAHVLFVPGPKGGFRERRDACPDNERIRRLYNLFLPICHLFNCTATIAPSREWAQDFVDKEIGFDIPSIYPRGWGMGCGQLVSGTLVDVKRAMDCNYSLPTAKAPEWAKNFISAYLRSSRSASITLRNSNISPQHNTSGLIWQELAETFESEGYRVIVLPDAQNPVSWDDFIPKRLKKYAEMPMAAFDPALRLALYEHCEINAMVIRGPASLIWHSEAPCHILADPMAITDMKWRRYNTAGIFLGVQIPWMRENQKVYWIKENEFPSVLMEDMKREVAA